MFPNNMRQNYGGSGYSNYPSYYSGQGPPPLEYVNRTNFNGSINQYNNSSNSNSTGLHSQSYSYLQNHFQNHFQNYNGSGIDLFQLQQQWTAHQQQLPDRRQQLGHYRHQYEEQRRQLECQVQVKEEPEEDVKYNIDCKEYTMDHAFKDKDLRDRVQEQKDIMTLAQLVAKEASDFMQASKMTRDFKKPPVSPSVNGSESGNSSSSIDVDMDFTEADLALATVPGMNFNPKSRVFSTEELRPQPIIKKKEQGN